MDGEGKVLVVIGALLLAAGAFVPVVSIPLQGQETLFGTGWSGTALIAVGALAALLALLNLTRHALWPGLVALLSLGWGYMLANARIAASEVRLREGLEKGFDDVFGAVKDLVAANARLEWGWAGPVWGALLVIGGAVAAWLSRRRVRRPG